MGRRQLSIVILGAVLAAGCGTRVAEEDRFRPEELAGTVDAGLPPKARARQRAVKRLLDMLLVEMVPADQIGGYEAGIDFEPPAGGFPGEEGSVASWKFDGPPQGDDVPVVLTLSEDGSPDNTREVKRTFTVTGSPGAWRIRVP
jgi:hypothetical protein